MSNSWGINPGSLERPSVERAFTLAETMVATAIFMIVLGGVISCHFFGVRLFQISKAKLGASDSARRAISKMADEIRSAKVIQVGTGSSDSFVEAASGAPQQGNSIQIHPATNPAVFVRYFRDPTDNALKRLSPDCKGCAIVAPSITNSVVFTAEDHLGNVLTNNQNNRAIGARLQFYQITDPVVPIGPGAWFDYYQVRTRITRRTLE